MRAERGAVGIISQGEALCDILVRMAPHRGLCLGKVVSPGRERHPSVSDLLCELGQDAATRLIGAYLEGIEDGSGFLGALRVASLKNPVVLWTAGLILERCRTSATYMAALARFRDARESFLRGTGAVLAQGFEPWVDALVAFALLPADLGDRMAIISGPGGLAVAAAEACGKEGLRLAEISDQTRERLASVVPPTGTSLGNPIDVGLSAFLQTEIYMETAWLVASDPGVDAVIVIGRGASREANEQFTERLIRTRKELNKPFLMVNIPGFDRDLARAFSEAGIPFFESAERAMRGCGLVRRYQAWRNGRS